VKKKILIIGIILIILGFLILPELDSPFCSKPSIGAAFTKQRDFGREITTQEMDEFLRKDGWNVRIYTPDSYYQLEEEQYPLLAKKRPWVLILRPKLEIRYNFFVNEPRALYFDIERLTGTWFVNKMVFNNFVNKVNLEFPGLNLNKSYNHFGYHINCD